MLHSKSKNFHLSRSGIRSATQTQRTIADRRVGTQKRQVNSGFTLIELLVYMGIFTILLAALTQVFLTILDTQLKSQSVTSAAREGQYLYSRFIYDVHQAEAINIPAALGASGNSLELTLHGTTYSYALNGTVLEITDGTGTYALNSYDTEISGLQFQRIGNIGGKHTVRITFTVTSKTRSQGRPEVHTFQTAAGLR